MMMNSSNLVTNVLMRSGAEERCRSVPVCTLFSRLPQASLLRSDSFFSGAVCFVRRTLAGSASHGFSIGFQRSKSARTVRAACPVHLLFSSFTGLAALLRSDGFFSGAVCIVRRTLAEALFMVFRLDSKGATGNRGPLQARARKTTTSVRGNSPNCTCSIVEESKSGYHSESEQKHS